MNELISVIVPVYNVEKYLSRCLDSIINQTYKNLDIILIDDGSTDKSALICQEYKNIDKRIKVIHQENRGLSGARNTGIDNAEGDYYVFIDSDDEILPEMIETLYAISKETNADISICHMHYVKENEEIKRNNKCQPIILVDENKFNLIYTNWMLAVVQWNKLFKKEIFNDLRFPEGMYHEDEFIIHHEFALAKIVAYTNEKLYIYYQHDESIVRTPSAKKKYHVMLAYKDRLDYCENNNLLNTAVSTYVRFKSFYNETINDIDKYNDKNEYLDKFKEMKNYLDNKRNKYKKNILLYIIKQKIHNLPLYLKQLLLKR